MTLEEIAQEIFYSPATNGRHIASIEKAKQLIKEYAIAYHEQEKLKDCQFNESFITTPPIDQSANQCDGCNAGIPVDNNGNHRMGKEGQYADFMGCQKSRYIPIDQTPRCQCTKSENISWNENFWNICKDCKQKIR